jgi:hypothetical protein
MRCIVVLMAFLVSATASAQRSSDDESAESKLGAAAQLGVYEGAGCDGAKQLEQFVKWFGKRPTRVLEFVDWKGMEMNATWSMRCWKKAGVRVMTYSVPMLPPEGSATLAQGAEGKYDALFEQLANTLVAEGYGDAIIRIGWEFNGDWYSWAASKDPQSWVAYWRRIVTTMRSVPGQQFKFDWCPATGSSRLKAEQVYPGDEYVDVIGLDVYNATWNKEITTPEQRWDERVNGPHGVKWQANLATKHGKPMSFPEWGTGTRSDGHGAGDDPYFIEKMSEWIATHDVLYHNYWDYAHPAYNAKLSDGKLPRSGAAFLRLFKSKHPRPPVLHNN